MDAVAKVVSAVSSNSISRGFCTTNTILLVLVAGVIVEIAVEKKNKTLQNST